MPIAAAGTLAPGESGAGSAEGEGAGAKPAESEPSAAKEEESPACPIKHSFVGSTGVLMADGSTKPISQVKVGDQVTNSVPGDATLQTHAVQKVIVTQTDRDFVDLTVKKLSTALGKAAAGLALAVAALVTAATPASADTSTLTTTYHHPFFDVTQSAFVDAVDLHPGDRLQTADGAPAEVTSVRAYHQTETTYDLTINGRHTYYVETSATAVLVHNCDGTNWSPKSKKTYGHVFEVHGAGPKNFKGLVGRAAGTGQEQGQWLDNEAAASLLQQHWDPDNLEPRVIDIPEGLGQVIRPDGSTAPATRALIVPRKPGGIYKTGFPVSEEYEG
ncbi:Hint domain-containing protein [Kutzneria sp. NPDC052558]|uniref:Hint domain-containing protein n=1 Tax=Kutzneria sp. NPDC052558 TaxID=3364121 RepID=UPI0037C5509E